MLLKRLKARENYYSYFLLLGIVININVNLSDARADFISSYHCTDSSKVCVSSGERQVGIYKISRPCWEWQYTKTCLVPSRNDCAQYAHCYSLGRKNCLLRDNYGACINWQKEFSCKSWEPTYVESDHIRYGYQERLGEDNLICEGMPCIDGNCIDKSYAMDQDMMDSISKLYALGRGKNDGYKFSIFEGTPRHCSKKIAGYCNCCKVIPSGWGRALGARCTKDEQILSDLRRKNLCIYVGKTASKKLGVTTVIKHHFCCFSNILEKSIQEQGRAQLGMNFGHGGNSNCRGFTFDELAKIDFSKIDFSSVAAEIQMKMVMPTGGDIQQRIKSAMPSIKHFNQEIPEDSSNKAAGVNRAAGSINEK